MLMTHCCIQLHFTYPFVYVNYSEVFFGVCLTKINTILLFSNRYSTLIPNNNFKYTIDSYYIIHFCIYNIYVVKCKYVNHFPTAFLFPFFILKHHFIHHSMSFTYNKCIFHKHMLPHKPCEYFINASK